LLKKTGAFFGNASFSKKDSFDKTFPSKEKVLLCGHE